MRRERGASSRQTETRASGHGSDVTAGTRGAGGATGPPGHRCSEVGVRPSFPRPDPIAPAGRRGLPAVPSTPRWGTQREPSTCQAQCPASGITRGKGEQKGRRTGVSGAASEKSCGVQCSGSQTSAQPQLPPLPPPACASLSSEAGLLRSHNPHPQTSEGCTPVKTRRRTHCAVLTPGTRLHPAGRAGPGMGLGRCSGPRGPQPPCAGWLRVSGLPS